MDKLCKKKGFGDVYRRHGCAAGIAGLFLAAGGAATPTVLTALGEINPWLFAGIYATSAVVGLASAYVILDSGQEMCAFDDF